MTHLLTRRAFTTLALGSLVGCEERATAPGSASAAASASASASASAPPPAPAPAPAPEYIPPLFRVRPALASRLPRLPRARALVLAGALMGGDIEKAVREVREQGLLVVSLNMAGSVPDAADFVVTDPVQAGVMAVMAVADTARFQSSRLKRRVF